MSSEALLGETPSPDVTRQQLPPDTPPPFNTTRLTSLAAECSRSGGRARQVQTIESAALSLFEMARSGDVMEVYALLRRFPSVWQSRDAEGCSALHAAASAGSMDMGQLLVHAGGADLVRWPDNDGWEALHYACANGHYSMAAWLLQSGADLSRPPTGAGSRCRRGTHRAGITRSLPRLSEAGLRAQTGRHEAVHLATAAGPSARPVVVRATDGAVIEARATTRVDADTQRGTLWRVTSAEPSEPSRAEAAEQSPGRAEPEPRTPPTQARGHAVLKQRPASLAI